MVSRRPPPSQGLLIDPGIENDSENPLSIGRSYSPPPGWQTRLRHPGGDVPVWHPLLNFISFSPVVHEWAALLLVSKHGVGGPLEDGTGVLVASKASKDASREGRGKCRAPCIQRQAQER